MNSTLARELLSLRASVFRARQFLDAVRVMLPRVLLKETLARYLADGIITAEVMDAALTARHPVGMEPLTRHLFEVSVDVMYLVTEPDPSYAAARTVAWNILRWDRIWTLQEQAEQKDPSLGPGKTPELRADEAIKNFAKSLEADGEDGSPVLRAYDELKARKPLPLHWSGGTRTRVVNEVERRASAVEPHLALLHGLWHMLSSDSHPSPWAARVRLAVDKTDGAVRFEPDPAIGTETATLQAASHGTIMLDLTRRWVAEGYSRSSSF